MATKDKPKATAAETQAADLAKLHEQAKDAKGVVIDGKTQTVLLAGRGALDISDTVMRIPMREMASIAASLLLTMVGQPAPMQIPDASATGPKIER